MNIVFISFLQRPFLGFFPNPSAPCFIKSSRSPLTYEGGIDTLVSPFSIVFRISSSAYRGPPFLSGQDFTGDFLSSLEVTTVSPVSSFVIAFSLFLLERIIDITCKFFHVACLILRPRLSRVARGFINSAVFGSA